MKTGEEYEQPAGVVILSSFVFGNTQQLLLAGIGEPYDPRTAKGTVGKNYCYQFEAGGEAFFEGREFNPFMGAPGMGAAIDDFNGENFDHANLGFFGGGYIACLNGGAPPIGGRVLPKGEPRWGVGWKQAEAKWYRCNTRFNTQEVRHMPTATITWTSIRPTRMRWAGRCCASPTTPPRTTTRCRAISSKRWRA